MTSYRKILSLVAMVMAICAHASQLVPATAPGFAYMGRVSHTYRPGAVAWTYPGVQIRCTFSGTSVKMKTNPDCGYFMVEIDDRAPRKVQSVKGDGITLLAKDLSEGEHALTLTYIIEGHGKKPTFYGLLLDDGCGLGERPVLPDRRIEFIGNSITCGYGIEGDGTEKTFLFSKQNFFYTYAAIAARNLGAQYQVCARSGIGLYRNYAGKIPDQIMPNVFPHTFYGTQGEQWDFSLFQPDVVCVNLGCNDTSVGKYDMARLTEAFKAFTKTLRGHYPQAKIVYLIGAIPVSKRLTDIQAAQDAAIADAASRGDHEVYRMDFTPDDGSLGMGSQGHPSLRRQALMGEELTIFLRQLTGWDVGRSPIEN
ncbi:MAG: lipase [Prevotella sp.]|nr:lipase [Prevotella sp.]